MRPTGIKADKTRGVLEITWQDGHMAAHDFYKLAANCRCASCNDERGQKRAKGERFEPQSRVLGAIEPVGSYGIAIMWDGGCRHGIYTWEYLLALEKSDPNTTGHVDRHSAW
jgi:DUF971 family protein